MSIPDYFLNAYYLHSKIKKCWNKPQLLYIVVIGVINPKLKYYDGRGGGEKLRKLTMNNPWSRSIDTIPFNATQRKVLC